MIKEPTVICSDDDSQIAHAVSIVQKEAKESGNVIWLYTTGLFIAPASPSWKKS
jgi:hypothetical protein